MAAPHRLLCTWLKNGPEFHAACCKVNWRHVPAHSPALLVLTFSASQTTRQSCGNSAHAHCPGPSATTSKAYIIYFGLVDLSICIVIISILLVRLAMGRCHGPSRLGDISRFSPRIDRIFSGEALNLFFGAQDEGFSEFRSREVHSRFWRWTSLLETSSQEVTVNPKPQNLEKIWFFENPIPYTLNPKP